MCLHGLGATQLREHGRGDTLSEHMHTCGGLQQREKRGATRDIDAQAGPSSDMRGTEDDWELQMRSR